MTATGRAVQENGCSSGIGWDLQALQADLEQRRRFRVRQLEQLGSSAGADSTRTADDNDARSQVAFALKAAATAVLADIDGALDRIERNCYGLCQECGVAIPLERLQALPMVSLCTWCQRAEEANGAGRSARLRDPTEPRPR